jgi:molybdopterin molybdotransferase
MALRAVIELIEQHRAGRRDRTERVTLAKARGRFLAEAVMVDRDSPPFDTAVMDGYAVRSTDLPHDATRTLPVCGEATIGQPPPALIAGSAVRIATGAAVPAGADAVLPRECVQEIGEADAVTAIRVNFQEAQEHRPGEHIRRSGENGHAGSVAVSAGRLLQASTIGTLAALGVSTPRVHARVRVAIVTTGEEIVAPESVPTAFEIRDSNGPAVEAALGARPWIELAWRRHARGDATELDSLLRTAARDCDALLITGGISMGHRDPVRAAIERLGARVIFHGLPQRPGKPMLAAIAARADGSLFTLFGLPGNPLSTLVTLERIAVPALTVQGGGEVPEPPRVTLMQGDGTGLAMWWHRLVRIDALGEAQLVPVRSSGDVIGGGAGDGFVEIPPSTDPASRGPFPFHAWPA